MQLRRHVTLLAAPIFATTIGEPGPNPCLHVDPNFGYTVEIPEGWSATSGHVYSRVCRTFLWIYNGIDPIPLVHPGRVPIDRAASEGASNGETSRVFWTYENAFQAAARILEPGSICITLGIVMGGIPCSLPSYARGVEDSPEYCFRELALAPIPQYESELLTSLGADATRAATWWFAYVHCRKPYSENDLGEALAILESLKFPVAPVTDSDYAAELAIQRIPKYAMHDYTGTGCVIGKLFEEWDVSAVGEDFLVTYTQLDGNEAPNVLRAYRYRVHRDARVELVAQRTGERLP